ncbi:MAG TPA: type II toxin-antitoxin system PemK/MazF family toxin [Planctomycetales bacterium]|jgi:mRNA interferase MazF|nr:type II toxin-antitoxin system PemK/MazF family toxin [Planctomycetales bacterium]
MNLTRGAIHWVGFPTTNGREQAGRRPAVIVQHEVVASSLPVVLAIPITGSVAALRFPGTVAIDSTSENGLSTRSVALVFQLRAVDRRRIEERAGILSDEVLDKLFTTLDQLLGRRHS